MRGRRDPWRRGSGLRRPLGRRDGREQFVDVASDALDDVLTASELDEQPPRRVALVFVLQVTTQGEDELGLVSVRQVVRLDLLPIGVHVRERRRRRRRELLWQCRRRRAVRRRRDEGHGAVGSALGVVDDLGVGDGGRCELDGHGSDHHGQQRSLELDGVTQLGLARLRAQRIRAQREHEQFAGADLTKNRLPPRLPSGQLVVEPYRAAGALEVVAQCLHGRPVLAGVTDEDRHRVPLLRAS